MNPKHQSTPELEILISYDHVQYNPKNFILYLEYAQSKKNFTKFSQLDKKRVFRV